MRQLLHILLALTLTSCKEEQKVIHIIYKDGNGIEANDHVQMNSKTIGEVLEVGLNANYSVLVSVHFQDSLPPAGSDYFIRETGFFGERMIEIIPSRSRFKTNPGDTVFGSFNPTKTDATRAISDLLETIRVLLSKEENDSLLNLISSLKLKVDSLESVRNNLDSTRNSQSDSSLQSSGT